MLYSIPPLSMRPLSTTIRRVWKTSTLRPIQSSLASKRAFATAIAQARVQRPPATKSKATRTRKAAAPATKPAAKKKPAKRAAKPKPKRKPIAKKKTPAKRAPKKKVLSEKQKGLLAKKKAKDKLLTLKEAALIASEPHKLLTHPFNLHIKNYYEGKELGGGPQKIGDVTREATKAYKTMAPADVEHINQTVKSNKQTNELAYKKWVTSFTPTEINKANKARTQLNKLLMKPGKNAPYKLIKDERRPKNPIPALFLFNKDRWASGDFRGLDVGAATRLVSAEWDALSAAEKKPYEERADLLRLTYHKEMETVYQ